MKVENAIKKLEKNGFEVEEFKGRGNDKYRGTRGDWVISFFRNGGDSGEAVNFRVRRKDDHDDIMSDYFAGSFTDNITQAIRIAGS